jgi:hypothetical protein
MREAFENTSSDLSGNSSKPDIWKTGPSTAHTVEHPREDYTKLCITLLGQNRYRGGKTWHISYGRSYKKYNVGYFHVVFTIPDTLNPVAYQNQKVVYNILFKAAAETLSELAADKKYLGAQIGFTEKVLLHSNGVTTRIAINKKIWI